MPERISGMLKNIYFDADKGTDGGGASTDKGQDAQQDQQETFEAWLEKQDDKIKGLYESHTNGLKSALSAERDTNKTLSGQLKELLPKAEKGRELEKQLTETVNKMEAAERRAQFAEEAIKPEIGCTNVKAAYALALADSLFDSRGNPKWAEIKTAAPELFRKAGSTDGGAGSKTSPATDINTAIRRAAGRE
jgi:hypothetical protein